MAELPDPFRPAHLPVLPSGTITNEEIIMAEEISTEDQGTLIEAALNHCNEVLGRVNHTLDYIHTRLGPRYADRARGRVRRLDKLLPGSPGDTTRCVIAQTLANATGLPVTVGDETRVDYPGMGVDHEMYSHPYMVDQFIKAFDSNLIPTLDTNVVKAKEYMEHKMAHEASILMSMETLAISDYCPCDAPAYPEWQTLWVPTEEVKRERVAETEALTPA